MPNKRDLGETISSSSSSRRSVLFRCRLGDAHSLSHQPLSVRSVRRWVGRTRPDFHSSSSCCYPMSDCEGMEGKGREGISRSCWDLFALNRRGCTGSVRANSLSVWRPRSHLSTYMYVYSSWYGRNRPALLIFNNLPGFLDAVVRAWTPGHGRGIVESSEPTSTYIDRCVAPLKLVADRLLLLVGCVYLEPVDECPCGGSGFEWEWDGEVAQRLIIYPARYCGAYLLR